MGRVCIWGKFELRRLYDGASLYIWGEFVNVASHPYSVASPSSPTCCAASSASAMLIADWRSSGWDLSTCFLIPSCNPSCNRVRRLCRQRCLVLLLLLLLATRYFHILPDIWFWSNVVTLTGTLTTTQAQTMVGSDVMMGSLGSKKFIFTKKASSPAEYLALTCNLRICISLTPSTKVITLKIHPGHLGSQGSKGHFHQKGIKSYGMHSIDAWFMHMHKLDPSTKVITLKNCRGSFGVTGVKRSFSLKML